jgi:predicted DNA-binding transcriptional regulator AlpA
MLSSDGVAELLCMSKRTLWRLVESGRFPQPVRHNRKLVRWKTADVRAWVNQQQTGDCRESALA